MNLHGLFDEYILYSIKMLGSFIKKEEREEREREKKKDTVTEFIDLLYRSKVQRFSIKAYISRDSDDKCIWTQ